MSTLSKKLDMLTFGTEQEMMTELNNMLGSVEGLESFLGVEFAFEDGSDDVDFTKYKANTDYDSVGFPKSFPAKLFCINLSNGSHMIWARWLEDTN